LQAKEAVQAFAETPGVVRADTADMARMFAAGAAARQDINLFYRLSADGVMLYHYPPAPGSTLGQDFSFREYFQAARSTQEYVFSKGRISPTTGRPVVTSVAPVFVDGRFDGVVATNLELQRLTETVRRIGLKEPHAQGIEIAIVDGSGQVIAHSELARMLEDVSGTMPGLSEVLSGREGSLIARDPWQKEWLYTYTPIPIAGWGVMVQRPTRLAFASFNSLQRGAYLALALFGLGAFFFWIFLSRRVIAPLEQLTRYGEGVGRQTLEAALDWETILPLSQRLDQVGRLTRALLRAERHIHRRIMELTTLNKTSAAVASTLDTQQVIDTVLNEIRRLLSVRQCALLVMDEQTGILKVRASRGLSHHYLTTLNQNLPVKNLPAYQAIASEAIVQVPDVNNNEDLAPLLPTLREARVRSLLVIPLKAPHVPPAALAIYRPDVHHFDEQEVDLAAGFANHAAIALEHATLFSLTDAELQKQVRFLSALNRVARTVSQSLVFEEVLGNAMDAVLQVMPVDACWIYLQRQTETFLRLRAQRGLPDALGEVLSARKIDFGQGLIGQVARAGQPLILTEPDLRHKTWADDPIVSADAWQSLAVTPLLAWNNSIGVLGTASRTAGAFAGGETELLQAIGDQIAIAVVNARLYRRSREVATLEERNRVAREIHDTLAQGFTGILLQLQAAERLSLKRPEQARHSLQEAQTLARESLQEARRSIFNLRPTVLYNLTLDEAIGQHVHRFGAGAGLEANFILEGYPSSLSPEVEQNLFRIVQEALTNTSRHANASAVSVCLSFDSRTVTLTITDDGIGLQQQNGQNGSGSNGGGAKSGFGLVGIQERANLMQGDVSFEGPAEGGTRIKVVVPK
ncbi:MAG: GAF domain-containing protein, partial [Anaerolineae bacterium]